MPPKPTKTLLVLEAPSELRDQAVTLFSVIAAKMGLPWRLACGNEAADRVERWPAVGSVEEIINTFVATLLGGGFQEISPPPPPPPTVVKKLGVAKVGRETAGRKGKGVTVIWELGLTGDQLQELATTLKQKCGTGGTVKDGRIEIQGDHRDRVVGELEKIGYKVKRAGG